MLNRIPLLFVAFWVLSIGTSAHAQLIAHYPFDTDYDDISGLGNHGTPQGFASLVADVPPALNSGNSLLLEENGDYVLVDHSESLDITEAMTVTAWIKTVGNAWEGLLAKNPSEGSPDNHAGNYEIRVENGSNQLHFLYEQGTPASTAFPISDDPRAAISPDTWTHIAVAVQQIGDAAGEVKYYTNGVHVDTKAINVGFGTTNTNPLYIGSRADLFTQFEGNIDDLRIYNTVLWDPEIQAVNQGEDLDFTVPFPIAGPGTIENVTLSHSVANRKYSEPSEDRVPGLGQSWYAEPNPNNKGAVDAIFQDNDRAVPYFQAESGTWWSGSDDVIDVPKYPAEIADADPFPLGGTPDNADSYTVKLEGEILIEESGLIRFLDGVDDFTYFAIDLDRSGTAGDTEEEVLINDNSWTNALSTGNGGSSIVEVDFENIAEGGEWLAMEFNMAEGGGGDHGMLYWDALDSEDLFPVEDGVGIEFEEDAAVLLIPDTHLQSPTEPSVLISADAVGTIPARQAGWEIDVNPADGTADTLTVENPDESVFSTVVDLEGITLAINPLGEVADGSSFLIVNADRVEGTPTIVTEGWTFDAATRSVVFGDPPCDPDSMGDLDGNGVVEFADFLILSGNFGQAVDSHTQGDIDCNGTVEFGDFLTLSANFGQNVGGAQSVPEPASLALMGLAAMFLATLRRRR